MNMPSTNRAFALMTTNRPLQLALVGYSALAGHLYFFQDDAYITFRYVANFLNGNGLVFNIGERIEGFTNFGWTIILAFFGVLGADFLVVSQFLGFLFGAGLLVVTCLIANDVFEQQSRWYGGVAVLLVGINQSLAYWAPAGLETAAFAFFALLSLYLYLKRSWLLIFALVIAVWLRPEGAAVTGILIMIEAIVERRLPRFTMTCAAIALLLSMPFVIFKILYYGSLLPNPFYAKTSFSMEQLWNGLEYTGRFFRHYGFYGAGLIVPLLFYRSLDRRARALWWYTIIYLAYIVLIGGDALKVHRFFLPLFGPAAILLTLSLLSVLKSTRVSRGRLVAMVLSLSLPLIGLTYYLPRDYVEHFNAREKIFTEKMQFQARQLLKVDQRNFSVAVATIGIFGYELLGHEIIDLVGLTDSTIARHSEEPIPGMETTWKEPKHNSKYILEREPDYILFSTGIKPSAPAERALLLYRQFTDGYRTIGWYRNNPDPRGARKLECVFLRVRTIPGEIEPFFPVEYVQLYKLGLDALTNNDWRTALSYYRRAADASPDPHFIYIDYQASFANLMLNQPAESDRLLDGILKRDSTVFEAHQDLYLRAIIKRDFDRAAIHARWLKKLVPWHWPEIKALGDQQLRMNPKGTYP